MKILDHKIREQIAEADTRGNEWLRKGLEAEAAGKKRRADECFRKGGFWLDRSNKLRGEC